MIIPNKNKPPELREFMKLIAGTHEDGRFQELIGYQRLYGRLPRHLNHPAHRVIS